MFPREGIRAGAGRFNGVDLLAELDYSGSPYSFGFNNPVYFSDPSGLFPGSSGTSNGQIHNDDDGKWIWNGVDWVGQDGAVSIYNYIDSEAHPIYSGGGGNSYFDGFFGPPGFGWMTIWGIDRSGNTTGWNGTTSHSVKSTDFVTPSSSRSLLNKTTGIWEWILSLFSNSISTVQQSDAIRQAVEQSPSTVEVQNVEPQIAQLSESTVRVFSLDTIKFYEKSLVTSYKDVITSSQSQIDSLQDVNEKYKSDYNLWLNHLDSLKK